MSNTRKTYHVVITDDQTGEVTHDMHACCIIAAFSDGERTGVCNVALRASTVDVAHTVAGAKQAVAMTCKHSPMVEALAELIAATTEEDE